MASFGLVVEDVAPPLPELWPENEAAVMVLAQMGTQWRVGMGGPIGLDYAALPVVLRLSGVPRGEWPGVFADLRVLEQAALKAMKGE